MPHDIQGIADSPISAFSCQTFLWYLMLGNAGKLLSCTLELVLLGLHDRCCIVQQGSVSFMRYHYSRKLCNTPGPTFEYGN